jgi:hypothetical protein
MPDTPPVVTMSFGSGGFPVVVVLGVLADVPAVLFIPAPLGWFVVARVVWSACDMGKDSEEGEMKTFA